MLFNSLAFLFFVPVVFALYWSVKNCRWQNRVVVLAGLFFYGWWDWRFLGLMVATCLVNYYAALSVGRARSKVVARRRLVAVVVFNLTLLAVFKYFNFFADNLSAMMSLVA